MSSKTQQSDFPPWEKLLGYLNFSSGTHDPRFHAHLDRLFRWLGPEGCTPEHLKATLETKLKEVRESSNIFAESEQVEAVIQLIFDDAWPAYRLHHADLLAHQPDEKLVTSFFLARLAEAVLAQGAPWYQSHRIASGAVQQLNDFIGHRPLAVLHNGRQTQPYDHERIRPVPLFVREAGVCTSEYEAVVEMALDLLRDTPESILEQADFSLDRLDELAFDPRAYDFGHPVNRRPNYQFGEWDPECIDSKGDYRRFVVRQVTLDALLDRVQTSSDLPKPELLWEAAAVLAGVILMASGTSGRGPGRFDSSTTLATLVPKIARYRDEFYEDLLSKQSGQRLARLRKEAQLARQPFGGARQHLNRYLARLRATQMQHVELARVFAEMGHQAGSERHASVVPVPRGRMSAEITCKLALAHRLLDRGKLQAAAEMVPQCEDLLQRAIHCGAFVDPWCILGFGGQFSIFPAIENSVQDPRVEELIDRVEGILNLYIRLISEAATTGADAQDLVAQLQKFADWWDQFATTEVSSVMSVSGQEASQSAQRLATVLNRWFHAGSDANDMVFWREQIDRFRSPKSYAMVVEALLTKGDYNAALALMMQWLSRAEQVPLEQDTFSFFALAMRWMQRHQRSRLFTATQPQEDQPQPEASGKHPWSLVRKFFDYLEVNADQYWEVPGLEIGSTIADLPSEPSASTDDAEDWSKLSGEPIDEDNPYEAAYEEMTFQDSTSDGVESDMMEEGPQPIEAEEWFNKAQWLGKRLRFLTIVAELWRLNVAHHLPDPNSTDADAADWQDSVWNWFERANENSHQLRRLLHALLAQPFEPAVSNSEESLIEEDRRRRIQYGLCQDVLTATIATERASMALLGALPASRVEHTEVWQELPDWQLHALRLEQAARTGDLEKVEASLPPLIEALRRQPLLYVPLNKGGDPERLVTAQRLQQVLREMLRLLPRLGMLHGTYQLIETAREMEKSYPVGPRAVTEFDRLFQIGFQALVEEVVDSSDTWASTDSEAEKLALEEQLVNLLQSMTESLLKQWLQHSQSVRLSILERVNEETHWQRIVQLITDYGHELFVTQFLNVGNLRSILEHGLENYLDSLHEHVPEEELPQLVHDLGTKLPRKQTIADLELMIEAILENHEQYKDYNSTTTQSDGGENLYMLLDFLRLKVSYDRVSWHLRPLSLAHEIMVRHGKLAAAETWRRVVAEKTRPAADWHQQRLTKLETKYSMHLPTISDAIRERFMRPFDLDRIRALVRPALQEIQSEQSGPTLAALEDELESFASTPTGAGLDVPQWILSLSDEVREARRWLESGQPEYEQHDEYPHIRLSLEELQEELSTWTELPPE